jgi:hypothetical protein
MVCICVRIEFIFAVDENTSSSLAVDVNVIPTPHLPPPLGVEPFLFAPAKKWLGQKTFLLHFAMSEKKETLRNGICWDLGAEFRDLEVFSQAKHAGMSMPKKDIIYLQRADFSTLPCPSCTVKFICSRIKKRRKPRVKIAQRTNFSLFVFLFFCHPPRRHPRALSSSFRITLSLASHGK